MADIAPLVLQIGASLGAVLLLWLLVRQLELGGDVRIRDTGHACALAAEAICGFDPVDVAIDRAGFGALARDAGGRVLLLRRHGAHFAGRLLDDPSGIQLDRNFLTIATGDHHFGKVTLDLGPRAQEWAGSFRRLGA